MKCFKLVTCLLVFGVCSSVVLCQSHQQQTQKLSNNEIGVGGESSHVANNPNIVSNNNNASPLGSISSVRDYGQSYYYPVGQKHVIWNRDTYAEAANDFANQQQHYGTSNNFVSNTEYGVPEGHDNENESGGGLGGLGGLAGLAGILGVKGIKGLGLLAVLKAGIPLLALLLPALLLLPLVFLFLPVPVITIPSTPQTRSLRSSGFQISDVTTKMSVLARNVLDSEKCVERMSCELSRVSRGSFLDKTLKRVFTKFETHLPKQLQRMARAYMDQSSYCNKKYACYLVDDNSISAKSSS